MKTAVIHIGLWRSLVARLHGAQEVVSSNLASPTKGKFELYAIYHDPF